MTVSANPKAAFEAFETTDSLSEAQIDSKAQEIIEQLSLDEKLSLMTGSTSFWPGLADMLSGGYGAHTWDAGRLERFGVPGIRFADGPRGIVMHGATTFPVSMARGATWDTDLEFRIGEAVGRELRSFGGNLFGGVCINLLRHPAWGRAQETYGEDPMHVGAFGVALTKGAQRHVMACVKHYALNSMENARFTVDIKVSSRALFEVYLPHFKAAVDAGAACVMSAYNSVNGEWAGHSHLLLNDILKTRWNFKGYVLTDFIFGMRDAKAAALGGQDVEMPFHLHFAKHLKELVQNNEIPLARVEDAGLRVLRQQIKFGAGTVNTRVLELNDGTRQTEMNYDASIIGGETHRALALEAAQKSIVLLKNDGLLPLQTNKKIAVIGHLANTPNTGDGGSSNTRPAYVVTPLEGLQKVFPNLVFDDGSDTERAKTVARNADAVILVVGYTKEDEGEFVSPEATSTVRELFPMPETPQDMQIAQAVVEGMAARAQTAGAFSAGGDRDSLTLHPSQEALIQAIASVNSSCVVAVMAGSAVMMEAWKNAVTSILMLWYPGMEGGQALADVISGKVSPSGKLPFAIPTDAAHLPFFDKDATSIEYDLWHGHRKLERDGHEPAFPFGFGLSYTTFSYSNLRVSLEGDRIGVALEVTNTGQARGDEIVQIYTAAHGSKVERAKKELQAFARVSLNPGETQTVSLEIGLTQLAYFDETKDDFVLEKIAFDIIAAQHSLDTQVIKVKLQLI